MFCLSLLSCLFAGVLKTLYVTKTVHENRLAVFTTYDFYPRNAVHKRGIRCRKVSVRPSVCLS